MSKIMSKIIPTEERRASAVWPHQDLRGWIDKLESNGLLRRVKAEVNWDREIGAITKAVLAKEGPALLFENIKDHQSTLSRRLFVGGLGTMERVNLALGLKPDTAPKETTKYLVKHLGRGIKPVLVNNGPVHENVLMGDDVDLYQLPVPRWHHLDGGRFIDTWAGIVTKDPETGLINVGMYRGMIVGRNKIAKLLVRAQDWGKHYTKWEALGKKMPIAIVYGWDELLSFMALLPCPHNQGLSEYDITGALRGEAVPLVKCKTVDLEVPASAEIVLEGYIDANELIMEGPFGEYTGYYGGGSSPKPTVTVECMTFRNDPIYRGSCEGNRPGMPNEENYCQGLALTAAAWSALDSAEVPGVTDVWAYPKVAGVTTYVQIHKQYRGHAKQVADALWGHKAAQWAFKTVMVVEEDIDIRNDEDMAWAFAFRVNPGEGDVLIHGPTFGSLLDPSTRREERDAVAYGSGKWYRMLIDATRNWDHSRWAEWDNNVFPPINKLSIEDEKLIRNRWEEYGLGLPYLTDGERERMTMEALMKVLPVVGLK